MKRIRKKIGAFLALVALGTLLASPLLAHAQVSGIPSSVTITGICEFGGKGIGGYFASLANTLTPGGFWECLTRGLLWFTSVILLALVHLFAWLLQLAIGFLVVIVKATQDVITAKVVTEGFKIVLSTVNLFFVLVLILIAFATILRLEQYGAKKFLARFIIAVVLVNFSFLFAGLLLDFSNVLTKQWLGSIQDEEKIANALAPQQFFRARSQSTTSTTTVSGSAAGPTINALGGALEAFFKMVLSLGFVILFTAIAMIVIFTTAILVLVRYVWLAILLILMPFAWLFWVAPFYREHASAWWNKFLKWTFFLPTTVFFFHLAFLASAAINETFKNATTNGLSSAYKQSLNNSVIPDNPFQLALNMTVLLGLLVGGLIAGQSVGGKIAAAGIAAAYGFSRGFGRFAGRAAGRPFVRPGRAAARGASTMLTKLSANRYLGGVANVFGARRAANVLAGVGKRKEDVEAYQEKNLSNLKDDQVKTMLQKPPAGPVAKAALVKEALKRKMFSDLDALPEKTVQDLARASKQAVGSDASKEFLKYRPDLAFEASDTTDYEDEVRKETGNAKNPLNAAEIKMVRERATNATIVKHDANDVLNYSVKVLSNPRYVAQFNNAKASALGSRGTDKQRDATIESLRMLDAATRKPPGIPRDLELDKFADAIIGAGGRTFDRFDQLLKFYASNASLQSTTIAPPTVTPGAPPAAAPPKA